MIVLEPINLNVPEEKDRAQANNSHGNSEKSSEANLTSCNSMAGLSAYFEFDHLQISRPQRRAAMRAATAASKLSAQWQQRADCVHARRCTREHSLVHFNQFGPLAKLISYGVMATEGPSRCASPLAADSFAKQALHLIHGP